MKLVKCPICGESYSDSYKACPFCAESGPYEGTVKRRISTILAKTGYDSIMKLAVHAVSDGYIVPKLK